MSYYNPLILFAKPPAGGGGGHHALTEDLMDSGDIPDDGTVFFSGEAEEITGAEIWTAFDNAFNALETAGYVSNVVAANVAFGGTEDTHKLNIMLPGTFDRVWSTFGSGTPVIHNKRGWEHTGTAAGDGSVGVNGIRPHTHGVVAFALYTDRPTTRDEGIDFGGVQSGGKDFRFRLLNDQTQIFYVLGGDVNQSNTIVSAVGVHYMERLSDTLTRYYNQGTLISEFDSDDLIGWPDILVSDGAYNIFDLLYTNATNQRFTQIWFFNTPVNQTTITNIMTQLEEDLHRL